MNACLLWREKASFLETAKEYEIRRPILIADLADTAMWQHSLTSRDESIELYFKHKHSLIVLCMLLVDFPTTVPQNDILLG